MATERFDIVIRARGTNQVNRKIKSIGTTSNSTRKLLALMRAALVIIASVQVIKGFTRLIDVFTEMRNRLRLLSDDTRVLATLQNALFKIAQETRASFETLGDIFFKTARATLRMRLSFKELLDITKVLAQTIAISGVATESANAALIQFGQGLASGALAGEELRSVSENLPELARIIGKEFGIAAGQLIAFNKANKNIFTTERLIKSLVDAIPELGAVIGRTQVTIAQGFTRVNNALVFFLGGVNDATGASKFLADGLTSIANNIDKVVVGLIVLTGLVVFNFLIGQVLSLVVLMKTLAVVVGTVLVRSFLLLIAPLRAIVGLFLSLRLAILTNPLFLIGAAAIGILVGAFFLFKEEILGTVDALGGLAGIFNTFVAFVGASIFTIVNNFRLIKDVVIGFFLGAINVVIDAIELILNSMVSALNQILRVAKKIIPGLSLILGDFEFSFIDLGRIENEGASALDALIKIFKTKFKEIEDLDPTATLEARFTAFFDFLKKFTKDGASVLDELLKLFPKGAGEGKDLIAELNKELNAVGAIIRGLSPLAEMRARMIRVTRALTKARAAGIDVLKEFGLTEDEIIRRTIRNQLGAGNAVAILTEKTKLLKDARISGNITAAEEIRLLRDARIAALRLDESFSGQLTLTLLEFQKELTNLGELAGNTVVNAFGAAEDAIVTFVTTGKLEFSSLINSILADLTRLAVRKAITAPLAGLLGIGDPGGGFFGSILGAFAGAATGGTAGGGNGGGSIPGLRTGGQFTVGGAGGADSKLIAFKATPGEEVTVTRPDQRSTGTGGISERPIQIIVNVETPNVESFGRAIDQVMNEAFIAASRANRRNS